MKSYLYIFLALAIGFVSCDGRKSSNKALSESVEDFKQKTTLQQTHYIPDATIEKTVDSTLSSGFRVKLKIETDTNNSVKITSLKNSIKYINFYKNFKFSISVEKEGKLIYNDTFDKVKANELFGFKDYFNQDSPFHNFNTMAVLKSIEIDDEPSLKPRVLINFSYAIPESNRYSDQTLFVLENGSINTVHTYVN